MIKNYTSRVPVGKSISHIEEKLVSHGAQSIVKQYENGQITGLSFFLNVGNRLLPFRLPIKPEEVLKFFKENNIRHPKLEEQAMRTAWKILSDWIDIQMTFVDLKQAVMPQIFMPYMWDEKLGKTFYQIAVDKGFNLIEGPRK